MSEFYAYLNDFNTITVIVPKTYRQGELETLTLRRGDDEETPLTLLKKESMGHEMKYTTRFAGYVLLNEPYRIEDDLGSHSELWTGKIVREPLFDDIYAYDGHDLGMTYRPEGTDFKVWTPVAKQVILCLRQPDQPLEKIPLTYRSNGVWHAHVAGDQERALYYFEGTVNGKTRVFTDPYGIASTANGRESVVIDPAKTRPFQHPKPPFSEHLNDAVIYEVSVRDFTVDFDDPTRGTFVGFVQEGLTTPQGQPAGFDYLKSLGVTHLQLLPIYDFEGVDETNRFEKYNWGYNPSQYNVPEGSYASDPHDPYARINELKALVDTCHAHGFRVIMDVVYNHVYETRTFPFEAMVPGYAFRVDDQGIMTDASGCGNDLATERKMIRKFIIDSALYWLKAYNLDGFRFDLMGLIDVKTINRLRQKMELLDPTLVLYGEGWNIPSTLPDIHRAHMNNKHVLYTVGHFNDRFREAIKGATFNVKDVGYIQGNFKNQPLIAHLLQGSVRDGQFRAPMESLNYVECHDNHTLFDKLMLALPDVALVDRHKMQRLATSMVVLAQGVPFIHAGQECFRSKDGVENSYQHPDAINRFDWSLVDRYPEAIDDLRQLIRLRLSEPLFRLKSRFAVLKHTHVYFSPHGCAVYELQKGATHYVVVFKCQPTHETMTLEEPFEVIFDSTRKTQGSHQEVPLEGIGTWVFKRTRKDAV